MSIYLLDVEFKAAMILLLSANACAPVRRRRGVCIRFCSFTYVKSFSLTVKIPSCSGGVVGTGRRRCYGRGRLCGCEYAMLRRLLFRASSNQRTERASTERVEKRGVCLLGGEENANCPGEQYTTLAMEWAAYSNGNGLWLTLPPQLWSTHDLM